MQAQRPPALSVATVLLGLLSAGSLALPFAAGNGGLPLPIAIVAALFGVAGLVAAAGLWTLRRWARPFAIVVAVLQILSAAPGATTAPSVGVSVGTLVTIIGMAAVVILLLLPASRRAYA